MNEMIDARLKDFKITLSGFSHNGPEDMVQNGIFRLSLDDNIKFMEIASTEPYISMRNTSDSFRVTVSDGEAQLELPKGVLVISGPSNSGKSNMCKYLQQQLQCDLVRFHEPEYTPDAIFAPEGLISRLENFMCDKNERVLIVDSFKFFAYNSDSHSAAISGGVSTKLFTELTNLSLLFASLGKTLIVVLNFISESDQNRAMILNGVIGSTGGFIALNNLSPQGNRIAFDFQARTESSKRQLQRYHTGELQWLVGGNMSTAESSTQISEIKADASLGDLHVRKDAASADIAKMFTKFKNRKD